MSMCKCEKGIVLNRVQVPYFGHRVTEKFKVRMSSKNMAMDKTTALIRWNEAELHIVFILESICLSKSHVYLSIVVKYQHYFIDKLFVFQSINSTPFTTYT